MESPSFVKLLKARSDPEFEASPMETLTIGIDGRTWGYITRDTFGEILGYTPRLQKLVIFHTNSLPHITFFQSPPHLSHINNPVDGTITAVGAYHHKWKCYNTFLHLSVSSRSWSRARIRLPSLRSSVYTD